MNYGHSRYELMGRRIRVSIIFLKIVLSLIARIDSDQQSKCSIASRLDLSRPIWRFTSFKIDDGHDERWFDKKQADRTGQGREQRSKTSSTAAVRMCAELQAPCLNNKSIIHGQGRAGQSKSVLVQFGLTTVKPKIRRGQSSRATGERSGRGIDWCITYEISLYQSP